MLFRSALNYGTSGTGSTSHIAGELFKAMAGVDVVRVNYKGVIAAIMDVVAGNVQLTFASPGTVIPHIQSGRLRALAVTSAQPSALMPDLPTVAETGIEDLAQAMVGRSVHLGRPSGASSGTPTLSAPKVLLRAEGLSWRDALGVARLREVSLTLHAGEIVGVAGVTGNGQSELLDVLSGLLTPEAGRLMLGERSFEAGHWLTPSLARELRVAHVPEDRHHRGLVLPFAAWESALLGYEERYTEHGFLRKGAMQAAAAEMMERYDVRPRNVMLRSSKFSGGNQQKLILAREAAPQPQVLLVGQPTRGVDIGAIEFIHGRLRALADAGGAVLVDRKSTRLNSSHT